MKKSVLIFIIALCLAFSVAALCACSDPTPEPEPEPQPTPVSATVTVKDGDSAITSLELNVGDSKTLTAVTDPADKSIEWTSSAPTVASIVKETGAITAKKPGTAKINASATDGSCEADVALRVVGSYFLTGKNNSSNGNSVLAKDPKASTTGFSDYSVATAVPAELALTQKSGEYKYELANVSLYRGDQFKIGFVKMNWSDVIGGGALSQTDLDKGDFELSSDNNMIVKASGKYSFTLDMTGTAPKLTYTVDKTGYVDVDYQYFTVSVRGNGNNWAQVDYPFSKVKIEKDNDEFKYDMYIKVAEGEEFQVLVGKGSDNPDWTGKFCTMFEASDLFGYSADKTSAKAKEAGIYKMTLEFTGAGDLTVTFPTEATAEEDVPEGVNVVDARYKEPPSTEHTVEEFTVKLTVKSYEFGGSSWTPVQPSAGEKTVNADGEWQYVITVTLADWNQIVFTSYATVSEEEKSVTIGMSDISSDTATDISDKFQTPSSDVIDSNSMQVKESCGGTYKFTITFVDWNNATILIEAGEAEDAIQPDSLS